MEQARQIRGPKQGVGALYSVPESARYSQQKPLFRVLEDAAITDAEAQAKNERRSDKELVLCEPFAFSFPLCDLLICEFNQADTVQPLSSSTEFRSEIVTKTNVYNTLQGIGAYTGSQPSPKSKAARPSLCQVAQVIYQRVVSRKPVAFFRHGRRDPKSLGVYVTELLECGHTRDAYFTEGVDELTARKRSCHECAGHNGGIILKKPSVAVQKSKERYRQKKQAGFLAWEWVAYGTIAVIVTTLLLAASWPKVIVYSAYGTPRISVRVLKQFNEFDFQLQTVVDGVAEQPASWHFCHDYKPLFEQGFTLTRLAWVDKGRCAEIGPIDAAYSILRGDDDWPIIPPNCKNFSYKPVECEGEPKFD